MKISGKILYVLLILLSVVRFVHLLNIPIFIDEQAHLYYSQISLQSGNYFVALPNRIFPVVPWIIGFFQLPLKGISPLLLGRIINVTSDLTSAALIFLIGKEIISRRYGLYSAIIYLLIPLNFIHSRLILLEPITQAFLLGALFVFIRALKRESFLLLVLSAFLLALSFLSKPTALASFGAFPAVLISFLLTQKNKNTKKLIINLLILGGLVLVLILPFVLPVIGKFSDLFVWKQAIILTNLKKNLWLNWWWAKAYITMPLMLITLGSFTITFYYKVWRMLWVFIWLFSTVLLVSFFAIYFFPRHMYPFAAPIALCAGFLYYQFFEKGKIFVLPAILVALLFFPLKLDFQIISAPEKAPIALEDKQQYFEDWTSGWGLNDVASYLSELSKSQKITVITESDGSFAWSLTNIYTTGNTQIIIDPKLDMPKEDYIPPLSITSQEIYILLNRNPDVAGKLPVTLIQSFPKHSQRRYIKLYKFTGNQKTVTF